MYSTREFGFAGLKNNQLSCLGGLAWVLWALLLIAVEVVGLVACVDLDLVFFVMAMSRFELSLNRLFGPLRLTMGNDYVRKAVGEAGDGLE